MRTRARRAHPAPVPHVNREGRHVHPLEWRTHERPLVLRALVRGTSNLTWSSRLLHLLLEELHVSDDFDRLIGSVHRRRPTEYPQVIAVALVLRHSRCRRDFTRTTKRLGLPVTRGRDSLQPRFTHAFNHPGRRSSPGPAPAWPKACTRLKETPMTTTSVPFGSLDGGHRVRELVCTYRPLRDHLGLQVRVPEVELCDPRTAAATLAPLVTDQPSRCSASPACRRDTASWRGTCSREGHERPRPCRPRMCSCPRC